MKIIKDNISIKELEEMAHNLFDNLVKIVVDIEKGIMAVDAGLHSDEEETLLQNGSKQQDLWGINIYPEKQDDSWIEFDSMINLRPMQGNRSRGIENPEIKEKIRKIINKLILR
ncbi:MAG: DUF5674 family protein [Patescibacteria group bacterium]|jgi:hypothetical protein|nr:DUF5674 family protein [Patescibacteria group bacterium]MDD5173084.1 DUF5674 family protein [Patescibacteria group bacterium]